MRIIFFGTPEFAAHSLKAILDEGYQVVAVVTAPDKPAGRGQKLKESAVKRVAAEYNLKILQPVNLKSPEFQNELRELKPDLGVVIAFRMLPEAVWSMPVMGTFNLHASLLPDYRGAAPINHAIINGESNTGLTTFFLKHEIDTGDILMQERIEIEPAETAGELHDKLMIRGADLVLDTLKMIKTGNWHSIPQNDDSQLHVAHKLNREFCELNTQDKALNIYNKIRGLSPYPGAWVKTDYGVLKIFKAEITSQKPGNDVMTIEDKCLFLNCADLRLKITEIQPEGKPRMKASDFINGLANR